MKNNMFLFLTILVVSCNEPENTPQEDKINQPNLSLRVPGTWKLVGMSGNIANSYTSGDDMYFQELILLKIDGTFIKLRETKEAKLQASGTYQWKKEVLSLFYSEDSELIGNCTGNLIETYRLNTDGLQGDWWACDGPGLFYELNTNIRG